MRIVIHGGQSKTGSTSIQEAFHAHAPLLLAHGILYPTVDDETPTHKWMTPGLVPPVAWQREFGPRDDADNVAARRANFERAFAEVTEAVARARPEILVISSEQIFDFDPDSLARLHALLLPLSAEQEMFCYVRRPSSRYLSLLQQDLKGTSDLRDPATFRSDAAPVLRQMRKVFGTVTFRAFQPSSLAGGEVVTDFLSHLTDDAELHAAIQPRRDNVSLSAEGMALMQRLRALAFADENNLLRKEAGLVVSLLRGIEADLPVTKPRLRPAMAALIDGNHRDDLAALAAEAGVVFDGTADPESPAALPALPPVTRLSDMIDFDPDLVERMTHQVIRSLAAEVLALAAERDAAARPAPTADAAASSHNA
ncbi:hypothetical protein [Methylobrevis pamukkalensis]|uniref:Uncharacterized protein n=1 Tax=Methylobrevis pamukkalensis TaxID=1439726 RepID=A0A1E3GXS7_9HYPH|nr:hypothetical protein [Methylobrevis pamukkalensis]ODN68824.1 hypothetical protein A6302_03877 [Methylobrevis pamukkalensis]